MNTSNFDQKVRANVSFKSYRNVFNNLVVSQSVKTSDPVISANISYDSKAAIVITKKNEREYWVTMYSLNNYEILFEEKVGGKPN